MYYLDDAYHYHHGAHAHHNGFVMIPYESFKGAFVGNHYRLQQLRLQSEHLDIYAVTCLCGHAFEAQAFSMSFPCGSKLLESRRRRMKRIYHSQNFVKAFEQAGKRFLVSGVRRTEAEWQNVCLQIIRQNAAAESNGGGRGDDPNRHHAIANCERNSRCGREHSPTLLLETPQAPKPASSSLSSESNPNPLSYARMVARGLESETE
ncbi:hypothetical protein SLS62_000400 [Diatrype stigma]|uniref:Uncharacterized protein n=1 Tax=Diatrype stigma TaxID=117547 RepID=A0AAN9VC35_9PEZI